MNPWSALLNEGMLAQGKDGSNEAVSRRAGKKAARDSVGDGELFAFLNGGRSLVGFSYLVVEITQGQEHGGITVADIGAVLHQTRALFRIAEDAKAGSNTQQGVGVRGVGYAGVLVKGDDGFVILLCVIGFDEVGTR